MRTSPLGIFGVRHDLLQVAKWAMQDAAITHPHPVCQQVNALFTMAISHSIRAESDQYALLNCRPMAGEANVTHPRPECFWPTEVLTIAEQLTSDQFAINCNEEAS